MEQALIWLMYVTIINFIISAACAIGAMQRYRHATKLLEEVRALAHRVLLIRNKR